MLSDDGGLLACALCAASAALVDAAVPLARTFGEQLCNSGLWDISLICQCQVSSFCVYSHAMPQSHAHSRSPERLACWCFAASMLLACSTWSWADEVQPCLQMLYGDWSCVLHAVAASVARTAEGVLLVDPDADEEEARPGILV